MSKQFDPIWKFTDNDGTFEITSPDKTSYLYFPLVNVAGMMSCVTPTLHGDIKTGQNAFLTRPVSVEDLHESRAARNVWVNIDGHTPWSASGNSVLQIAQSYSPGGDEDVKVEAGFLWQTVSRFHKESSLCAQITNLVPESSDQVELMSVTLVNNSSSPLKLTVTIAVPIYGRSADNLRDHRHVTSLLHRITTHPHGVVVKPTLSFDERGHLQNKLQYAVLGCEQDGSCPTEIFPLLEDYRGEGGTLDWPKAVVDKLSSAHQPNENLEGYEALGGLRFKSLELSPGASYRYTAVLAVYEAPTTAEQLLANYGGTAQFEAWHTKTRAYWKTRLDDIRFQTADPQFNVWMRWVTAQPIFRQLFGNSFLPYHDYGRGGRGWRDLWQDILGLLLIRTDDEVSEALLGHFAGIRFDGSNATIIGSQPGEFKADRNNIPRVWMDHGAWPFLTTKFYIDQTGDLDFLLSDQTYFKDHLIERAQAEDPDWEPVQGTLQRGCSGDVYQGSVLEHLLLQHLTAFFNVGEHNHIKLEGGDWNDGMDMAAKRGESVAFSAMYAGNLRQFSQLLRELSITGVRQVEIASELLLLLDTLQSRVDYDDIEAKRNRLREYFTAVSHAVSGKKVPASLQDLADDLLIKSNWMVQHIRNREWLSNVDGYGWFNGYYDNKGQRLEGDHPKGVRMTLTGQVFTLMSGIATDEMAGRIIRSADHYLFDANVGGYRLNTNFKEVLLDMGRCFGFAYGHKENGAMFSHMAVMYAYALYVRGFARQAHLVLDHIYQHSINFPVSRMYPGIPEYFSSRGRGVYPYLTGSASWYLLTLLTQAFGVRGQLGDLVLFPKLVPEQFDSKGEASVKTWFADRQLHVTYLNPGRLEYGNYKVARVRLNEQDLHLDSFNDGCLIPRDMISALDPKQTHKITAWLADN